MSLLPAMPRVLGVPELLDNICSYLSGTSLTRAARVNKAWFDIAVPFIWEHLGDIIPVLDLLAPGGFVDNYGKLVYEPTIVPSKERFDLYARYIRSLRIDDGDERYTILLCTFLDLLPVASPCSQMPDSSPAPFPRLRTLEWIAHNESSLDRSTLFMHPSIHSFYLTLPSSYSYSPPVSLPGHVDTVMSLMPHIANLVVLFDGLPDIVERQVIRLIDEYKDTLLTLGLTRYLTSSRAVLGVAQGLAKLNSIYTVTTGRPSLGFDPSLSSRQYQLSPSLGPPFPSLVKLELFCPFGKFVDWLKSCPSPTSLTHFKLVSPILESRHSVQSLFHTLSLPSLFPSLQTLESLYIMKDAYRILPERLYPGVDECPHIDDLECLIKATEGRLKEFVFQHEFPLVFGSSNRQEGDGYANKRLECLLRHLPNVVALGLNPSPDFGVDDESYDEFDEPLEEDEGLERDRTYFIGLGSLALISELCPRLEELALYVDLCVGDLDDSRNFFSNCFQHLEYLLLGGPGRIGGFVFSLPSPPLSPSIFAPGRDHSRGLIPGLKTDLDDLLEEVTTFLARLLPAQSQCEVRSGSIWRVRGVMHDVVDERLEFWDAVMRMLRAGYEIGRGGNGGRQ